MEGPGHCALMESSDEKGWKCPGVVKRLSVEFDCRDRGCYVATRIHVNCRDNVATEVSVSR